MELFNELINNIKGKKRRLVFTEGEEIRVLSAAVRLANNDILTPVILGNIKKIKTIAKSHQLSLEKVDLVDMENFDRKDEMVKSMLQLRRGKMTEFEVIKALEKSNYFGTMLVKIGYADCLLGGATYSTADTIRPALQLIKAQPGSNIVSSMFIMVRKYKGKEQRIVMGDCAINISPSAEDLVDITYQMAEGAERFGIKPKVALLSYSTLGSGKGDSVEKVRQTAQRLKNMSLLYDIEGELQFDAAYDPIVASIKAPNSKVAGQANVFVFPNIDSGNIGYKIAQRLGEFEALGPIILGLNAPINDLSRGCNTEEVYKMAIITANQK